jgi:hypothetical protein
MLLAAGAVEPTAAAAFWTAPSEPAAESASAPQPTSEPTTSTATATTSATATAPESAAPTDSVSAAISQCWHEADGSRSLQQGLSNEGCVIAGITVVQGVQQQRRFASGEAIGFIGCIYHQVQFLATWAMKQATWIATNRAYAVCRA